MCCGLVWRLLWRVALFAPLWTPLVATAVVWRYLLHTRYGLVNYLLSLVGAGPVDWLGSPTASLPAILLFVGWKSFGYNMIIFLAALQTVPRELEEAARSEEHTSELQSLMRISYAVFCLKKTKKNDKNHTHTTL